jgi:hypothetical protein
MRAPEGSDRAALIQGWNEQIDEWVAEFLEDLDDDVQGENGIFQNEISVDGAGEFKRLMLMRAKNYAQYMKKRIVQLDEQWGEELEDDDFDNEAKRIFEDTDLELQELKDQVVNTSQIFARQEGHKGKIDTYQELWLFNQNLQPFFKDIETPEGRAEWEADAEDLRPDVEAAFASQQEVVQRLLESENEELTSADYDRVLAGLKAQWQSPIVPKDAQGEVNVHDQTKMIERTGALLPLHAMNARQRFELADRLVETAPEEEAKKGVLFLSHFGFLDIEQTQVLLSTFNGELSETEIQEIQLTHQAVEKAKKVFADLLEKGSSTNPITHFGISSNVLVYEVTGRLALLGALIPLILHIGSPSKWPNVILDPAWLASVGVGAASVEHITGGFGKGVVTKAVMGATEVPEELTDEETKERFDKEHLEKLDALCGNHPDATEFLLNNDAEMLTAINEVENEYEQEEHQGYFLFSFEALVEHFLQEQKQANEEAGHPWSRAQEAEERNRLTREMERGRDGVSEKQTEQVIHDIYHLLSYDLKLSDPEAMVDVIAEGRARRGIA